jgi:small conductance mechanosensitive channel
LVLGSIIIVFGSFVVVWIVGRLIQDVVRRAGVNKGAARTIRDIMALIWLISAVSGVATFTGLASEFTALTISGIGGLTISLALQNTIQNIISGFLIFRDGAIRVDDVIECSGVKGTVVRMALRNTWVRTSDGKIAIIGNTTLTSGPLTNHSATERLNRKIES